MIRAVAGCLLLLSLLSPNARAEGPGWTADVKALTAGVGRLEKVGVPGPLIVFGKQAFPVVLGKTSGGRQALVAASRYGKGRIVAFGHGGYLHPGAPGRERLQGNAVRWCLAGRAGKVGVIGGPALLAKLKAAGLGAVPARLDALDGLAVLVADAHLLRAARLPAVDAFLRAGGGLVTASLGWGWKQLNRGKDLLRDHQGNRLLLRAGLVWADGYLETTAGRRFAVGAVPGAMCHARLALDALLGKQPLSPGERLQAAATLTAAIRGLPGDDPLLARLAGRPGARYPTRKRPLRPGDALARIALTYQLVRAARAQPGAIAAHPAARDFPGVPPADARAETRTVAVDTRIPDWHGTGLYAAPGAVVTVTMPRAVGAGFRVRIGCHKDLVWHKPTWKRAPRITRSFAVTGRVTRAACAFGGLVYVVVPRGRGALGTLEIKVEGGIPAPRYVLGQTSLEAWRKTIRHRPAPWAEIGSRKMIVSVPSATIRALDDPDALMRTWDRVVDLNEELCGRSAAARRPMRMVCDRQISAGYMHAGYPIMTWMDQQKNLVDRAHLLKGNWGFFHEIGHNHQHPDWTFGGTGEVTCNLFTLYVYDRLCGSPPEKQGRMDLAARRKLMARFRFDRPDFGQWKRSPFLALVMYVQLQQQFGWQTYRKVFRGYLALKPGQRPKTDQQRRDMWMTRFSRACGRNLGPFFQRWGVPTTPAARARLSDLEPWLPAELPAGK